MNKTSHISNNCRDGPECIESRIRGEIDNNILMISLPETLPGNLACMPCCCCCCCCCWGLVVMRLCAAAMGTLMWEVGVVMLTVRFWVPAETTAMREEGIGPIRTGPEVNEGKKIRINQIHYRKNKQHINFEWGTHIKERLQQGSQTRGPPDVFMRPALSSKFPLSWIKLHFYEVLEYFLVILWPTETFLPTCAARELF